MIQKGSKVTINEIANAVGVSKTTVSRYLNGRLDLMSKKTVERIKAVIELSDYNPSEFARALKSHKTRMIGVVISDIESPWSSSIISACGAELRRHGYTPIFMDSSNSEEEEREVVSALAARGVDGLIINTSSYHNKYLIEYAAKEIPIVLCDRYIKDYNFDIATFEAENSMLALIRHLHEQGFSRLAMFTQEWQNISSRFRKIEGYKKAVSQIYGFPEQNSIYTIHIGDIQGTILQIRKFMSTVEPGEKPVIICINTMTTFHVLSCLQREALSIPRDIGLCGSDDWGWDEDVSLAGTLYPPITTIRIDSKEIGRQCASLMLDRIKDNGQSVKTIQVPCTISVRASTLLKKPTSK